MFRFKLRVRWYDPEGYYVDRSGDTVTVIAPTKTEAIAKAAAVLGEQTYRSHRRTFELIGPIEEIDDAVLATPAQRTALDAGEGDET